MSNSLFIRGSVWSVSCSSLFEFLQDFDSVPSEILQWTYMKESYDSKIEEEGVSEYSEYHEDEKMLLEELEEIDMLRAETKGKLRTIEKQLEEISGITKLAEERENLLTLEEKSSLIQVRAGVERNKETAQEIITMLNKEKADLEEAIQALSKLRVTVDSILERTPKDKMH